MLMSYIRQNNKFYFQVIDLMVVLIMPDLRAAGKSPYGSSTSAIRAAVTHKVIHRNCAELFSGDKHRCGGVKTPLPYFCAWT
jgi:hypothetical protein